MNNKSTPLNLLPNAQQQLQPQQFGGAAQNFSSPINTQLLGGDYSRDEDATIQETLMQLNGSESINQLPPLQAIAGGQGSTGTPVAAGANAIRSVPITGMSPTQGQGQAQGQGQGNGTMTGTGMGFQAPYYNNNASSSSSNWWSVFGELDDLKLVALVVLITIALTLVPMDCLVQQYLPSILARLPYAETASRALLAGVMFYVLRAVLI